MSGLQDYSYPDKHRNILIFKSIDTKLGAVKEYIHPQGTVLKAYARQLSSNEQHQEEATQDWATIEFVINYREISVDMFIEYDGNVYSINSKDGLGLYKTELKLQAHPVPGKKYIETRWSR
jgi:SPP1 family predicted phage head-tail adaptor